MVLKFVLLGFFVLVCFGRRGSVQSKIDSVWGSSGTIKIDSMGNLIKYGEYGNRDSVFGWEIDHIIPKSRGGSNDIDNLQPLQWEANVLKGNKMP